MGHSYPEPYLPGCNASSPHSPSPRVPDGRGSVGRAGTSRHDVAPTPPPLPTPPHPSPHTAPPPHSHCRAAYVSSLAHASCQVAPAPFEEMDGWVPVCGVCGCVGVGGSTRSGVAPGPGHARSYSTTPHNPQQTARQEHIRSLPPLDHMAHTYPSPTYLSIPSRCHTSSPCPPAP